MIRRRAVSYLRVASPDAGDQSSLAAQRKACRQLAQATNLAVVAEYVDRSRSGTRRDRPGLQALLERVHRRHDVAYVLVSSVDRWSEAASLTDELADELERSDAYLVTRAP